VTETRADMIASLSDEQLDDLAAQEGLDLPADATRQDFIDAVTADSSITKATIEEARGVTDQADTAADTTTEEPAAQGSLDPALNDPVGTAQAAAEGTSIDAATHVEGFEGEVAPGPSSGAQASEGATVVSGDFDQATAEVIESDTEWFPGINADDWVVLDGASERVPDALDGARAVVLNAPTEAVLYGERGTVELTVRTRDQYNATLSILGEDVKQVLKGSQTVVRG